jgi:hypothetical protein
MARWVVAILVAVLAVVSCLAGQEAAHRPSIPAAPTSDCLQRSIPLTVVKNSASTWDWHSLSLTVSGKPVPIASMLATPQVPRVVVLVDTSGSMGPGSGPVRWGVGLRAAAFAVEATPLDALVSLGTFNEQDRFGKFESRQEVGNELLAMAQGGKPNHGTALYRALKDAAGQLQPSRFGDTIFLVTDAGDNRSGELQKKVQQELAAQGIRVFVFMVWGRDFHTPEEREGPELMAELANATGGKVFEEPWSKEWVASDYAKQLMEQVQTMARWPHILQFKLDQPLKKAAKLKIVPPDIHALELAYPHQVLPCFALDAKAH